MIINAQERAYCRDALTVRTYNSASLGTTVSKLPISRSAGTTSNGVLLYTNNTVRVLAGHCVMVSASLDCGYTSTNPAPTIFFSIRSGTTSGFAPSSGTQIQNAYSSGSNHIAIPGVIVKCESETYFAICAYFSGSGTVGASAGTYISVVDLGTY